MLEGEYDMTTSEKLEKLLTFSQSDGEYDTADISNTLLMIALSNLDFADLCRNSATINYDLDTSLKGRGGVFVLGTKFIVKCGNK